MPKAYPYVGLVYVRTYRSQSRRALPSALEHFVSCNA